MVISLAPLRGALNAKIMETIELQSDDNDKYFICDCCGQLNWLNEDVHVGDEVECECCGSKYILN